MFLVAGIRVVGRSIWRVCQSHGPSRGRGHRGHSAVAKCDSSLQRGAKSLTNEPRDWMLPMLEVTFRSSSFHLQAGPRFGEAS